jgi:hypothetical protein
MGLRDAPVADEDGQNLERGLIVLVIFLWPAVTWLHSRGRNIEAVILAVSVALASILAPSPLPLQALSVGAVVFALTAFAPFIASRGLALVMAGLLLLAPAIPFVMKPLMANWVGLDSATTAGLAVWQSVVVSEPLRLITGHGLETALRGRISGLLDPHAPGTFLFEIWYELGLVGAGAGAAVLFASVTGASGDRPLLTPGIMAAFATAFTFGCLGIGTAQAWWFTALLILVLIFVAVERGQFRTTRPKAVLRRGR